MIYGWSRRRRRRRWMERMIEGSMGQVLNFGVLDDVVVEGED